MCKSVTRGAMTVLITYSKYSTALRDTVHVGKSMFIANLYDETVTSSTIASSHLDISTVRGRRTADIVFDCFTFAIALLIAFGIGCRTTLTDVRLHVKFPVSLIIGFCAQFIMLPVLAFGLIMLIPADNDIRLGLLCTACIPGGGMGHLAVVVNGNDVPLSLTMNLIGVVAMLGTAPLWLFVLGQYLQLDVYGMPSLQLTNFYKIELCLVAVLTAHATGLLVQHACPNRAAVMLTWFIMPFLLLATILYVTVGVYINMYVFEPINYYAVLGAVLLPLTGCLLGCSLATLCRQNTSVMKTIALHTSSLNGLIVLAALRFSLQQPDADLASVVPIWIMFTTPGLYVAMAIVQRIYEIVQRHCSSRSSSDGGDEDNTESGFNDKRKHVHRVYDTISGVENRTEETSILSSPLVTEYSVQKAIHKIKVTSL